MTTHLLRAAVLLASGLGLSACISFGGSAPPAQVVVAPADATVVPPGSVVVKPY